MTSFDALNNLTTDEEELIKKQIVEFFEEMDLPEEEIKQRINFACDLEIIFRNLFLIMLGAYALDNLEEQMQSFKDYATIGFIDAMVKNKFSDDVEHQAYGYIEQYAKQRCNDIVDTTAMHIADEYYTGTKHSIAIGENEANAVGNYDREQRAIASGATHKTWITKRDTRVRHTHVVLDGKTINIFDTFNVGKYRAFFPMDDSLGMGQEEIANCRCIVDYSGKK